MADLRDFTVGDMLQLSSALAHLSVGATSVEEVARRTVAHLIENLTHEGEPSCALVRFYKTHPFAGLERGLQAFILSGPDPTPPPPETPCLTLFATAGREPAWNSRRASRGHRAIPLPSPDAVARLPMVAQLIKQFGLSADSVLRPKPPLVVDLSGKNFNVFHVPVALGSPHVPAQQDFVIPFGIKSVLGFGGLLPSGNFFAVILFTTVAVPRATADRFKSLALSVQGAVMKLERRAVFAPNAE